MQSSDAFTPIIRVSRVLGARVLDEFGQRVGVISDVVLDKDSNAILCAVIGRDGFWGLSQTYLPVPWPALQYDLFDRAYKLEGSRSEWSDGWRESFDDLTCQSLIVERAGIHVSYRGLEANRPPAGPGGSR